MDEKTKERPEKLETLYQEITTGIPFTPSNVEKLSTFNLTDAGNAELFRDLACDKFCYIPENGHWYKYNSIYWEQNDEAATLMMLNIHRRRIDLMNSSLMSTSNNHSDLRSKIIKFSLSSESSFKLKAALSIAQCMLVKKYSEFDRDPYLLCCENGVVDLHNGKFRQSKPEDHLNKCTHITYNSNDDCPRWHKFLEEIFCNDDEMIQFNHKAIGYSLTAKISEQCLFICYGPGENGKSTYLDTLDTLLGDFSHTCGMDTFKERYHDNSIPNDVAALCGKRFVKSIESKEGARLNEERVKALTGGDRIAARFLHHEWFNFDPTHKIWLAVNHKPIIRGTDRAIWRRIRLIPFENSFPDEKKDKHLKEKLIQELPGILNWAILGCILWQDEGLSPAKKIKDATQEYREESDIVGKFLHECVIKKIGTKIKATDLYNCYINWCKESGEVEIKQTTFGIKMTEKGFTKNRGTGGHYYYQNLELKSE